MNILQGNSLNDDMQSTLKLLFSKLQQLNQKIERKVTIKETEGEEVIFRQSNDWEDWVGGTGW